MKKEFFGKGQASTAPPLRIGAPKSPKSDQGRPINKN